MQYKTTIEVVTDASNKNEAADIAGEFLRGDLGNGANLKVKTISVTKLTWIKIALVVCSTAAISGMFFIGGDLYYKVAKVNERSVATYAIQPPLKTNLKDSKNQQFKEAWEKENKDRINSLAR